MPFVDTAKGDPNRPVAKPATVRQALPAVLVAAFAAVGGLLYGYDTGTINGLLGMEYFRKEFGQFYEVNIPSNSNLAKPTPGWDLSTHQKSLTVSILSIGTFVGALLGAPLSDILGRRWGLQVALLVFCVGVAMQTASTYLALFDGGRFVAGLGVGIVSTIVPMYQSETAPRWIRGACVSGYQWFITIGLLVAAIANNGTQNYNNSGSYRIPIAIQIGFALCMSIGIIFLPESPRWLIKRGRTEDAARSLAYLNSTDLDDPLVRSELADVQTNLDIELTHGTGSYLDCFKGGERKHRLRTFTGMGLQAWQQLTGINFIFYYGTNFFITTQTGGDPNAVIDTKAKAYVFTIISNVVNVITTLPGMYMMERVGRRRLLIWGALWMTVCEFIVAITGTAAPSDNVNAQRVLVAFVCIYIAGFASTWGPAAWVVCGEIFPLAIRAKALSLCVASNWLFNWAIGYATPYLVDSGPGNAGLGTKVFFIWGSTCFCAAVFAYLFIYETSGLSLEEVDELYCITNPMGSAKANSDMRARRTDFQGQVEKVHDDEADQADMNKKEVMASTA